MGWVLKPSNPLTLNTLQQGDARWRKALRCNSLHNKHTARLVPTLDPEKEIKTHKKCLLYLSKRKKL